MSFNVTPKGAISQVPMKTTPGDTVARAVAKFNESAGGQPKVDPEASKQTAAAPETPQKDTVGEQPVAASAEAPMPPSSEVAASEAPAAPKTPDPVSPEEPLSSQYAQLARKERALRAKAQEVQAKEAALKAREEELSRQQPAAPKEPTFEELFDKDPWSALQRKGISYDQLTERALNAPSPEKVAQDAYMAKLEAKIAALEEGQVKVKKTFEETQANAYKQAIAQIRADATKLVANDPTFETVHATGSVGDVVELIERTFKEGLGDDMPKGTVLTVKEAAQMVEDHLMEEALKIVKLKKIQDKLKPAASASTPATPAQQVAASAAAAAPAAPKQPQQQFKTLTNAISSTGKLSARERAILAFKGEIK